MHSLILLQCSLNLTLRLVTSLKLHFLYLAKMIQHHKQKTTDVCVTYVQGRISKTGMVPKSPNNRPLLLLQVKSRLQSGQERVIVPRETVRCLLQSILLKEQCTPAVGVKTAAVCKLELVLLH